MSNELSPADSSPTTKFVRKTLAKLDKITNNHHLPTSHDRNILESRNTTPLEAEYQEAERQEKLERLARNESTRSSSSDDSTASPRYREIEMGGARKMGPDEVGKMFD